MTVSLPPQSEHHVPTLQPTGWLRYFSFSVDHKVIGLQYLVCGFLFYLIGGALAGAIRTELLSPLSDFMPRDVYNQVLTLHGTVMIFLWIVPVVNGAFGNYLIPFYVGARDMAFPRLNAVAFWLIPPAGLLLISSYFITGAAQSGWTAYPPLSITTPASGQIIWILSVLLLGGSSIFGGINFIATVLKLRRPGLKLMQLPMYCHADQHSRGALHPSSGWNADSAQFRHRCPHRLLQPRPGRKCSGLSTPFLVLFPPSRLHHGVTSLRAGQRNPAGALPKAPVRLRHDGVFDHGDCDPGSGGLGPHCSPVAHHLDAPVLHHCHRIIAVPTGIKFFNWLATLWGGRISLNSAVLFSCGFIINFVLGGITGVALAQVPFDVHVHDTYFVVAHFHYIVYGGTVFVIFASIYHWYPKVTGRMLNETLGRLHFLLTFILTCFAPQHWLGLNGMPRRVAEYDPQFAFINQLSSAGALLMAISTLPFLWNVIASAFRGKIAGDNPWQALTPEWLTSSPPPVENWKGEAPLVTEPYGYGAPLDEIDLAATSGRDLWSSGK